MQGTRDRILAYLVQHGECRVEALEREVAISTVAIRRHLDHLRADALVTVRAVKQATGRPYYLYGPSEAALSTSSSGYADLLERTLVGLGQRGELLAPVATAIAEALASRHRSEMPSGHDTRLRVEQVTESLRQDGILESWRQDEDGFHLINAVCPYRKAAEISPLPCETDRQAIALLLDLDRGVEVEQVHRLVDGAPICEYLVRTARPAHLNLDPELALEIAQ